MILACLLAAVLPQEEPPSPPSLDRPWTSDAALCSFEKGLERVACVGDLTGDGYPEVLTLELGIPARFKLYSTRSGAFLHTVWAGVLPKQSFRPGWVAWDAGGDMDGDGIHDVVIGLPENEGIVLVVSVKTGELLHTSQGEDEHDGHGSAVACLGDVDGDGHGDYAVGAGQAPQDARILDVEGVSSFIGGSRGLRIRLKDGRVVPAQEAYDEGMRRRSDRPGYVEVRSGTTGERIWRVEGTVPGHAFGADLNALGDLDGDGVRDLAAMQDRFSAHPARILSGATGKEIGTLDRKHGELSDVGDVNGDGASDISVIARKIDYSAQIGPARIYSGKTLELLFEHRLPNWFPDSVRASKLVDLNGDGYGEFALGDASFHIAGPGNYGFSEGREPLGLASLTLEEATKVQCATRWGMDASGCLWVVSGRTREVLFGIWGKPGSLDALGRHAIAIPDVTGDDLPDLVVTGYRDSWVFPGPGRRPR